VPAGLRRPDYRLGPGPDSAAGLERLAYDDLCQHEARWGDCDPRTPLNTVNLGEKEIYVFKDFKVAFTNGRVIFRQTEK
jgi:hypothetical protein